MVAAQHITLADPHGPAAYIRGVRRNRPVTPDYGTWRTHGPQVKHFLAYTRVSTEEQADQRNGLEAQRAAIDAEAERRGWTVEHFADEGSSGKYINGGLRNALQLLASGQADGLIVAKLDRLARSIVHAANIIEDAQAQGWSLVVLDMNVDLTTAAGRMIAGSSLVNFAQYERELISERTKAGLAAKKRRGERIGRPRLAQPGVVRRIVLDRNAGLSFDRIARALEAEGILSPAGRPTWQPSTVRRIYQSASTQRNRRQANGTHPRARHHAAQQANGKPVKRYEVVWREQATDANGLPHGWRARQESYPTREQAEARRDELNAAKHTATGTSALADQRRRVNCHSASTRAHG